MQRVKRKENKITPNNVKLKESSYTNINNISNGNNTIKNSHHKYDINSHTIKNRSNKFLSIPERQKIIHEINQSKNQLNLYQPPPQPGKTNTDSKNLLYIKKTKSDLNLLDKVLNQKKSKNNRNTNSNIGYNNLKFTKNKNLVNKTIKEYYKKNENPFKTYLKSLNNNELHSKLNNCHKKHNANQIFSSENNKVKINNNNKSEKNNKNVIINEIYKKPISIKVVSKGSANNVNDKYKYQKNNYKPDSNKVYINNSAKKEKINCTKMINNNGVKKNIFNIIDNYNTKTIKNSSIKDNLMKMNFKKQNNIHEFLTKNNSSTNFNIKKNLNINENNNLKSNNDNNKKYFYNNINKFRKINTTTDFNVKNNNSCKNNKSINIFNPTFFEDYHQINDYNNINNNILTINDYYTINSKREDETYKNKNQKTYYYNNNSNNNNNNNMKYTKKNIKSPEGMKIPKKMVFKGNFIDDDLTKFLVEKDLNYYLTPNESDFGLLNNGKINNSNKYNENNKKKDNIRLNNKYLYETELFMNKKNNNKYNRINTYVNTEVKNNRANKSMTLSLEESSKKENKRNKSFSYVSNKDDENDEYFSQNGNNNYDYDYNYKYQNGKSLSPSYIDKYNYYRPSNTLITKEIIFPFGVKNNNSFYNSDDDIMNSNNNSNLGSFNDSNNIITGVNYNNSFDNRINNSTFNEKKFISNSKSNNNIFAPNQSPSPIKDYYFNYLSNKINNDFLNENKFNNLESNLYNSEFLNRNTFCDKCKRNYCPYCCGLSRGIDLNSQGNINKKVTPLKYLNENYYPNIVHSKTISMNYENNNLKKDLNKNKEKLYEEENDNIKKNLITRNIDLKLDVSNGKHSSENNNQNLNINAWEGGSFNSNSNKLEITGNDMNLTIKNDLNKIEQEQIKSEEKKPTEKINETKDKIINLDEEIIKNKDIEIDRTEQTKSLSGITSSDKFQQKVEGINLSNNEFLLNENNNNENSTKKNFKNNSLLKDKEEKEEIEIKTYKKMNDIIQNVQVTPKTNRNSFIKDNSINNNENNFTKTDIETNTNNNINTNSTNINNINSNNSRTIPKTFTIKEDLTKKNYINNKNQLESPLLSDILENINLITPKNYFIIKDKILNIIINNDPNISLLFVNILYPIAINQKKFQPVYAKLCKDLDKCHNKKDKSKSIIRTQLMKFCKANFKKIKFCLENIVYIVSDINFIGELINAQMVSKKVGIQCLTHLVNKFNQYNSNKKLMNKKKEKYLYLYCIVNLLNQFGTCIYCYQKNKIREDEFLVFNKDIINNINILKEIAKNRLNDDMPNETKLQLLKLIEKSENNWELTLIEKYKNKLLQKIYEEPNIDNNNNNIYNKNTSDTKYDKNTFTNTYKNLNKPNKSVSPFNNKIDEDKNNNNTILNKKTQKANINININKNNEKILSDYSKIIEKNIDLFKNHMNEYQSGDNFNEWEEIDSLFLNKKIQKYEIFISILQACKHFAKDKNDIYYIDIYIKIVFEYYYTYLDTNDINGIMNSILEELSKFAEEKIKQEENKYEIEKQIWIIIIYYLLQNKIMKMNDFNYFCKGYNKDIKTIIFNILNSVCCYNNDNKHFFLKELKNTKFANINKKILSNILQNKIEN